jgi:hypothetical protein
MKNEDLIALAALAGGVYGLNEARKVDKSLGPKVNLRADGSPDPYPNKKSVSSKELRESRESLRDELTREDYGNASPERLKRARAAAIQEEPSLRGVMVDSSGMPVRSGSGYVRSGQYKKGGAVKTKSASSRADGIAQRGKTKGRIV